METAAILKDAEGNIAVDENGCASCISEGGVEFKIAYKDIDFSYNQLTCNVGNKTVIIVLNENIETVNENIETRVEVFTWTDASTKLFLCLYKKNMELLAIRKIKNKKVVWQKISEEMNLQRYNVSQVQVENKFKSLERSYKNMITNNKKSGRGRMTCLYERELSELIGNKHNILPLATSGSSGTTSRSEMTTATFITVSDNSTHNEIRQQSQELIISERPVTSLVTAAAPASATGSAGAEVNQNYSNRQMGRSAKLLQACENSSKQIIERMEEQKKHRIQHQQEILNEQRQLRELYKQHLSKVEQQLVLANKLREERNELLKNIVNKTNN